MKNVLFLFGLIFCASHAHATNCALTTGASQSTITTALTAAGSGSCVGTGSANTVAFAAGTYGPITSTVTIPCNANMSGPAVAYSQTPNQSATIDGSTSNRYWGFETTAGCSGPQTIQYLEWNGEHASGAGGFLEITPGTINNFTIQYDWLHGVQTNSASPDNTTTDLINFGGKSSSAVSSNITIQWNIFGPTSFGDCSIAMKVDVTDVDTSGTCNGIGMDGNLANVTITHNIFHYLEEGVKFFEGPTASGACDNVVLSYNNFSMISRMEVETQCNVGSASQPTLMYIQYNNFGNRYGGMLNYDLSAANGCFNFAHCVTHSDYNFDLQANNTTPGDVGFEIWGGTSTRGVGTTSSYNLFQGYLYDAITYAPQGQFVFDNNTFNIVNNGTNTDCTVGAGGVWKKEDNPTFLPSCTGNTFSYNITGTYPSASPNVAPSGGTYSGGTTISISTSGANRDRNTSNWCTTDGSSPAAGSGTSTIMTSYTLPDSGSVTLQCIGMWGAANQPTSYPAGYGYVPSAVTSASYTIATSGPTSLVGVVLRSVDGGATMTVGGPIMKMVAYATYENGSSGTLPDEYGNVVTWWNTSNHRVAKVSTGGHVTAVGAGSVNIEALVGALSATPWSVTVTAPSTTSVKRDTVAPMEAKATGLDPLGWK